METMTERAYTGVMSEINDTGDTRVMWNKDVAEEVDAARETFNRLTRTGRYTAFNVKGRSGDRGERMTTFDPEAERVILVPQLQGG